jgi:hypothetical protein
MNNLGPQFATKDWNPFLAASNLLDKVASRNSSEYRAAFAAQNRMRNTADAPKQSSTVRTTPTPANTGAPYPGYRTQGPINPSTTGAPVPGTSKNKTATHPTTGAQVPRVPVKPRGKRPTAPGTRPKKR